jgi:hypothetical protein
MLENIKVFCVVDGVEVPPDRKKRRSITCSDECAKKRNDYLRERKELRKCKYCGNPGTPEERDEFRAWRRDKKVAARLAAKKAVTA